MNNQTDKLLKIRAISLLRRVLNDSGLAQPYKLRDEFNPNPKTEYETGCPQGNLLNEIHQFLNEKPKLV